ncbi:MAG: hypothetical protein V2A55_03515 [Candidatus Jorgensenbacteria bacterium]
MKRRLRNILFATFVLLFVLVGGYLIFIAQGFVVNFDDFRIEKTGAIFLKFTPRDAVLSINGEETDYSQGGFLESSGVIIKNLAPGSYRLNLSKNDYHAWEKNLEVQSGLITSESHVNLWPKNLPEETVIEQNVKDFWLTGEGVIHKNGDNRLIFNDLMIRGENVFLSAPESKILITEEGEEHFLVDLKDPRSAVNLSHLFNSLKQRQLALAGAVPITDVLFHPFSPNKIVIVSKTSLYTIDVEKVQIEKLVTLEEIKSVALSTSDAFIIDGNDNLAIINLLLKTSLHETTKIGPTRGFTTNSDGTSVFILTPENELKIYRRSSGKIDTLATNVREFEISPEEKRVAVITYGNELEIAYSENFEGDIKNEAGTIVKIPDAFQGNIKSVGWFADLPNYLIFLENGNLTVQEIDTRVPVNRHLLITGVLNYETEDKNIYILKDSGELTVSAIPTS